MKRDGACSFPTRSYDAECLAKRHLHIVARLSVSEVRIVNNQLIKIELKIIYSFY